jgi:benzoate transport
MSRYQLLVVVVCVAINMIDGFDVLAISFAAPDIAKQWQLPPAMLGLLLSVGPLGMALGSLFLSPFADLIGRRKTSLVCMIVITLGMMFSGFAQNFAELGILRVVTGLGIGGILASANTLVAEYSSDKRRALAVAWMAAGYPIGATLGGLAAVYLLGAYGWPSVFAFGAVCSALLVPIMIGLLPESLDYLVSRTRPENRAAALARINATLRKTQRPPLAAFPEIATRPRAVFSVFAPETGRSAALICSGFFLVMFSFYFLLTWTPKILVDLGLSTTLGVSGAVLMNFGGIVGGLLFGLGAGALGVRKFGAAVMVLCFLSALAFAALPANLFVLLPVGCVLGLFMFASMTSLYALAPIIFPIEARATGTGLGIGLGRIGAVLGPYAAGLLIGAGWSRLSYTLLLTLPFLLAAVAISRIRPVAGLEGRA